MNKLTMSTPKVLRKLRLTLILTALFLMIVGAVALANIVRLSNADKLHTHTYEVLVKNSDMSHALDDMNVQAADYALTHDAAELQALLRYEKEFELHYQKILSLTQDNSEQQARLKELLASYTVWRGGYIKPILAMAPKDSQDSDGSRLKMLTDLTDRSRADLAKTQNILNSIDKAERTLLLDRSRKRTRLQDISLWTLAAGIIALAAVVAILSIVLLRRMHDLSITNTALQNEMRQREMVQHEILESQLVFHTFMDNNPSVAYMTDAEGRVVYSNKPLQRILGKAQEELIGKTVFDWQPEEVARRIDEDDKAVLASGRAQERTECLPDGEGILHSWLVLKFPFQNRDAEPVLGVVAIDISESKAAEEKLNQSQANLKALIENTEDIIWSVDRDYRLITFNSVFNDLVTAYAGRPAQAGENHLEYLRSPLHERWLNHYMRAFTGERFNFEIVSERDGVPIDLEIALNPIVTDGEVTGATVFGRDITERKKIDRMKSEFVSTVSHELRTPLTSIRGSLGLLVGGVAGDLPPEAHKLMDIALTNSDRLVRLINDILDIEKIESGKMSFDLQPTRLVPLLNESLQSNRAYAERLGVTYKLQNDLPAGPAQDLSVYVDPHRLSQVMANLLSNAAKFSPSGGEVAVTVALRPPSPELAGMGAMPSVRISVRDQGPGVPDEFRDRIFQKFAQADSSDTRQKGGTGLGLSISKAIIEQFEGEIGFDSSAGGASFYFDLPLRQDPTKAETLQQKPLVPDRILICEDDPDISRLLCLMLGQVGYDCTVALTATEAKNLLHTGSYAAMTLDLMLPDQNGVSLIRELREDAKTYDLPIVVVSAQAENGRDELNGDAIGIVDWLEKPIDDHRLKAAVQLAVAGAPGRRPHILHVEDDIDIVHIVSTVLQDAGELDCAGSLQSAREKLETHHYDLIILDVGLPDGNGLDLLPLLHTADRNIPVVIFSARELNQSDAQSANTALVKSRTSNDDLLRIIHDIIQNVHKREQL